MKQTRRNLFKPAFILVIMLSVFSTLCPGEEKTYHRFMVTAGGNFFIPSQVEYRQIYGTKVFMPEIKIMGLVYRNFTAWGSFGLIGKDGLIEEIDETAHIRQTLISIGVGYMHRVNASLRLRGELGLNYISYKEEALDDTQVGSGFGLKIGANVDFLISKRIFVTLAGAFSTASDEAETGRIKLGGFQAGAGLGFAF
jgi:hypothetical protein